MKKLIDFLIVIIVSVNVFGQGWSEDWDGNPNWYLDWSVDAGQWQVGIPTFGPSNAFRGDSCAATVLSGNYSDGIDSTKLISPPIQIPSTYYNPRLTFSHWYNFNSGDYGKVQLKLPNGTWVNIL